MVLRLLLMGAMLGAFLALGAARTAWSDPAVDPTSVARHANGSSVRLRGEVISEPDLRDGARLLTIEVSSIRVGDNGPTRPASGRITTAYYGPDDWFAPGYGDTLSLSGDLVSLNGRYAPPGVVAGSPFAALTVSDVPALAIFAYYAALMFAIWGIPAILRSVRRRAQTARDAAEPASVQQIQRKAGHIRLGAD